MVKWTIISPFSISRECAGFLTRRTSPTLVESDCCHLWRLKSVLYGSQLSPFSSLCQPPIRVRNMSDFKTFEQQKNHCHSQFLQLDEKWNSTLGCNTFWHGLRNIEYAQNHCCDVSASIVVTLIIKRRHG